MFLTYNVKTTTTTNNNIQRKFKDNNNEQQHTTKVSDSRLCLARGRHVAMYVGIDERLAFYGSKSVGSWNLREIVRSFRGKLRCTRERGCSQDTRTSFTRALPPRQHRDPWPATTPAPPTLPPSTPTLVVSRKRKHLSLPAIRTPPTARRFFTCCRPRLEPDPRRLPQQQEQVRVFCELLRMSTQYYCCARFIDTATAATVFPAEHYQTSRAGSTLSRTSSTVRFSVPFLFA